MASIPISKLHPDQALSILKTSPTPPITVSLVDAIMNRYGELVDDHKKKLFGQILESRFPEMFYFADSQSTARVKRTVSQVAFALNQKEEGIKLWYEAFTKGRDISSLFELLDYLIQDGDISRAANFIHDAFQYSLKSHIVDSDFSQEVRASFYKNLIIYAYSVGANTFAVDMLYTLSGTYIPEGDTRILTYKKSIRTPEEFDIACQGVWAVHAHGDASSGVTPKNIHSLELYINEQIRYLGEHKQIQPDMLSHLTEGIVIDVDTEEWYDYRTEQGQLYFQVHMALFLALVYRNQNAADGVLEFLDGFGTDALDMLADIIDSMNNPTDEELGDDDVTAEQIVCSEVLIPMLDMFQGLEHIGLQQRILSHMEQLAPMEAKIHRDAYLTRNIARQHHLTSTGILPYYFEFRQDIDYQYTPVLAKSVLDAVINGVDYPFFSWNIELYLYYLVEYMALYGRPAEMSPGHIQFIHTNKDSLTQLGYEFLGQFYPQHFV